MSVLSMTYDAIPSPGVLKQDEGINRLYRKDLRKVVLEVANEMRKKQENLLIRELHMSWALRNELQENIRNSLNFSSLLHLSRAISMK